jgi:pimeloyl-ACP methyl ester carboxylesterase
MRYRPTLTLFVMLVTLMTSQPMAAQSAKLGQSGSSAPQQTGDPKPYKYDPPATQHDPATQTPTACDPGCVRRSSPFAPPKANDSNFVVDCDTGLDTGCTFRNGGPLVFTIKVCRFVGDFQKLKANGLIAATARLDMPAFDVDFFGAPGVNPERDRVSFNGHVVPSEFLRGDNNIWELNSFNIPAEWIKFPEVDPGPGGTPTPADNVIRIDIDTANAQDIWCTAIDWAALTIDVARPVVFVHGIFSSGGAWNKPEFSWVNKLSDLGLPNSNRLNMGDLDNIQNNSGKISTEVANATQRWGVDRVNLVCHSKGGIDSRHFVENNESVERVIQLGTPNGGTPVADYAQGILVLSIGIIGTAIVNGLAGQGGKQLTTGYMRDYNSHHRSNPKVRYTALAGSYDPDCSSFVCRVANALLFSILGPSDFLVPVTSVHKLDYTENRLFQSSGGNREATHTMLNDSLGVFNSVGDRVKTFGTSAALAVSAPLPVVRTVTVAGVISQGQVQTQAIQIDQATPTFFSLMFPSGDLNLALISPSGQRFDASTIVGNPNVSREELEILGGLLEVYGFATPEVGTWTAEISAPSVVDPSGSVGYAVSGFLQNPAIVFTGGFARVNVHSGDALRLLGTLKNNGAPLVGASVMGKIGLPDGTAQTISLHDDGAGGDMTANDGIYTGDFASTSQSGDYRVLFTASRAAAPSFSREDFGLATVSRSSSTLTGSFSDSGQDTDGNGLFNNLILNVAINVTAVANYRVLGILTDSRGNTHQASVQAALSAGLNTVPLRFDGAPFFNNRVDGPYALTTVRLAEDSGGDILPLDERTNAFQTAAYSFRSFEHGPLVLTGNGSAVGVDTNGNGLFDILRVGVEIDVATAGVYNWSARLTDRNGKEIGFSTNSGSLAAGLGTLQLNYDGHAIGLNGVDGPYFINSLLVFGPGGSLVAPNALTTGPFQAAQFEGGCSLTCPASITQPNDTGQCGAIVNYAPPVTGSCGTVVCTPPTGSFFPVGTTTVTCTSSGGPNCSFTITVNDLEKPSITCPAKITAVTNQNLCPSPACQGVNYQAPVATDNCPGPITTQCNPPSGSCFPVGVTTVSCTATDTSGNISLPCTFTVTTFDVALQDDSNPSTILLWNSTTGQYRFCCNGITFTGFGKSSVRGCVYTLEHNPSDRRVLGRVDKAVHAGSATIQSPPGTIRCTITDRNTLNDMNLTSCQ